MSEKIKEYVLIFNPSYDQKTLGLEILCLVDDVLSYCNITDLPEQLERILAKHIVETQERVKGLKSLAQGDTKFEYASGNSFDNLKPILNRFRKVRLCTTHTSAE